MAGTRAPRVTRSRSLVLVAGFTILVALASSVAASDSSDDDVDRDSDSDRDTDAPDASEEVEELAPSEDVPLHEFEIPISTTGKASGKEKTVHKQAFFLRGRAWLFASTVRVHSAHPAP